MTCPLCKGERLIKNSDFDGKPYGGWHRCPVCTVSKYNPALGTYQLAETNGRKPIPVPEPPAEGGA